jgi:hypothetical protein
MDVLRDWPIAQAFDVPSEFGFARKAVARTVWHADRSLSQVSNGPPILIAPLVSLRIQGPASDQADTLHSHKL